MYISPAVRTMRDDPTDGVDAPLVVRLDDEDAIDPTRATLAEFGHVESETRFGNVHATVPQSAVADLLAALPDAAEAVETRTVVGTTDPDA